MCCLQTNKFQLLLLRRDVLLRIISTLAVEIPVTRLDGDGTQMLVGCSAVYLFTISAPCPTPLLSQIGRFAERRCVHYQSFAGLEQSLISSWHLEEYFTFGLTFLPTQRMEEQALGGSNQT